MKLFTQFAFIGFTMALVATNSAEARGGGLMGGFREESAMVSNGQGISSPSFWNGISGANPAGILINQGFKLQGSGASFDDSTKNLRQSGGLFMGNGMLAAGGEYSTYNAAPLATGSSVINFGAGIRLSPVNTSLGVSGHQYSNGGGSYYDVGILIDLAPTLRLGGMLKDVTHGIHVMGAGLTLAADQMVDFVVDAGYRQDAKQGVVKPGLSLHTNLIQATAAYGFRFTGYSDDVLVTTKFTAGLGLKLAEKLLVEYEYRALPQHRLGLTLRFN